MQGEPFVPSLTPPEGRQDEAWWFVFRGTTLLVRKSEGRAHLPFVEHPSTLGVEVLRSQYLGMLGSAHVYSAECEETVEPPGDMTWAGLRSLFSAIDDHTFALAGRAIQIMD